jgi:hypothetical protein
MTAVALTQERISSPPSSSIVNIGGERAASSSRGIAAVPVLLVAAWFAFPARPLPFASRYRMQPVTTATYCATCTRRGTFRR